jgi:hypothetical protein
MFCSGCGKRVPDIFLMGGHVSGIPFGQCRTCGKVWCYDCDKKEDRGNLIYHKCPNCNETLTTNISQELSSKSTNEAKSGCFIATACFGNYYAPEVIYLCQFRDDVLGRTSLGRYIISFYYFLSPYLAKIISQYKILSVVVKTAILRPLILLIHKYRQNDH